MLQVLYVLILLSLVYVIVSCIQTIRALQAEVTRLVTPKPRTVVSGDRLPHSMRTLGDFRAATWSLPDALQINPVWYEYPNEDDDPQVRLCAVCIGGEIVGNEDRRAVNIMVELVYADAYEFEATEMETIAWPQTLPGDRHAESAIEDARAGGAEVGRGEADSGSESGGTRRV